MRLEAPARQCFLVIAVALTCAVFERPLRAECIAARLSDVQRDATLVFEGTVLKVEARQHPEYATTLEVHRVWKGDVPKHIVVYHTQNTNGPDLREGVRRIIFSMRQTPLIRKALGLSDAEPLREVWVPPCSGAWAPDESVVRQLGTSRAPRALVDDR